MKKIIALALALIMALSMGSVAFAATADPCSVTDHDHRLVPGATIPVVWTVTTESATDFNDNVATSKDYKATAKWTKGGALVDEVVYLKAADAPETVGQAGWYIVLNENYTITAAKDIEGTITFDGKKENKDKEYKIAIDFAVSNCLREIDVNEDVDDADTYEADDNTLYMCPEEENGYVKFNSGALLGVTLNMVSKEKAFLYNDEAMIDALEEKFPEADLECYNFGGAPTFKNAAEFTLQADYADQYYIYAYANGKLEAQDAEWDSIEGVYTWETKSPVSYVISDVELVAAADDAATTNPDTGANDVVGVAAALAVVSLVAAGAVSLKK